MSTFAQWKQAVVTFGESHETELTYVLIGIGLALIAVAVFGKTEHKLAACVYIVL